MIIVGRDILESAGQVHGKALRKALARWAAVVDGASWSKPAELKQTYGNASFVKQFVVFNVKGNDFRLVATINYGSCVVSVERVMTHAEYDQWSASLR